ASPLCVLEGAGHAVERQRPQRGEVMRQYGLVDDADRPAIGFEPDRAGGLAVNLHAALIKDAAEKWKPAFGVGWGLPCPTRRLAPLSAGPQGSSSWRSTGRSNTTTARGCRSIRRYS